MPATSKRPSESKCVVWTGTSERELLMVDGVRVPPMTNQVSVLDAAFTFQDM